MPDLCLQEPGYWALVMDHLQQNGSFSSIERDGDFCSLKEQRFKGDPIQVSLLPVSNLRNLTHLRLDMYNMEDLPLFSEMSLRRHRSERRPVM